MKGDYNRYPKEFKIGDVYSGPSWELTRMTNKNFVRCMLNLLDEKLLKKDEIKKNPEAVKEGT